MGALLLTTPCGEPAPADEMDAVPPSRAERPAVPPAAADSVAALTYCEVDDDCVLRDVGCCDVCNGGTLMSVARARQEDAVAHFKEPCDAFHSCLLLGWCEERESVPACVQHECARWVPTFPGLWVWGPVESSSAREPEEEDNGVSWTLQANVPPRRGDPSGAG